MKTGVVDPVPYSDPSFTLSNYPDPDGNNIKTIKHSPLPPLFLSLCYTRVVDPVPYADPA